MKFDARNHAENNNHSMGEEICKIMNQSVNNSNDLHTQESLYVKENDKMKPSLNTYQLTKPCLNTHQFSTHGSKCP